MREPEPEQDPKMEDVVPSPSGLRTPGRAPNPAGRVPTAIRHLVLGFAFLVTILFTAALCSLPR
jgi:hypothetical protein